MQPTTLLLTTFLTLASGQFVRVPRAANSTAAASSSLAGADFGSCTPTMDFQFGRAEFNRAANIGTFFPTDPTLIASTGQTDALNPNIITNVSDHYLLPMICGGPLSPVFGGSRRITP